ncbi:dihydrofolate reductase family protein [Hansschlegelia beijingensis]
MISPSGGAAPLPPDDAAAWGAVRAVRQGAVVPASLENHPLCRMMLPVARPDALVLAQLGQSLDGRIATLGGGSALINGPCGLDHLHRLRALADAVLVGVGTVCVVAEAEARGGVRPGGGDRPFRLGRDALRP